MYAINILLTSLVIMYFNMAVCVPVYLGGSLGALVCIAVSVAQIWQIIMDIALLNLLVKSFRQINKLAYFQSSTL